MTAFGPFALLLAIAAFLWGADARQEDAPEVRRDKRKRLREGVKNLVEKAKRKGREAAMLLPGGAKLSLSTRKPGESRTSRRKARPVRTPSPNGTARAAQRRARPALRRRSFAEPARPEGRSDAEREATQKAKRARLKARLRAARDRQRASKPTEPAATLTPAQHAQSLYRYVTEVETNAHQWGTKASPNAQVRAHQSGMGGLVADGIYGPLTRARGKVLTGKTFPIRA